MIADPAAPARLLLVDDDPGAIVVLQAALGDLGELRFALSGADALLRCDEAVPDLVLLDAGLGDVDGLDLLVALRADPRLLDVPILLVTSRADAATELRGLELGASDFVAKPVQPALLRARVSTHLRLRRLTAELRHLAETDALTGLANRRRFDAALADAVRRAARTGDPLAVLVADLDHFKRFNDRHGHPAGDACLRAVGAALAPLARRPGDLVARIGGEEFAVVLPNTGADGAAERGHAACEVVRALAPGPAGSALAETVTLSVGAAWGVPGRGADEPAHAGLLAAADRALYAAKAEGRDRCVLRPVDGERRA